VDESKPLPTSKTWIPMDARTASSFDSSSEKNMNPPNSTIRLEISEMHSIASRVALSYGRAGKQGLTLVRFCAQPEPF